MEKIDLVMQLIRGKKETLWIAEQLTETFSEGVLVEMKEIEKYEDFYTQATDITIKEKTKRKKYGTTRPYYDQERLDLLESGLKKVFVELPAIQTSTFNRIKVFNSAISEITFTPPDETNDEAEYTIRLSDVSESRANLEKRYNNFVEKLKQ